MQQDQPQLQYVHMPEISKGDLANRDLIRDMVKEKQVLRKDENHAVKISLIRIRFNPREIFEGIEELAESLQNIGQSQPGLLVPMADGTFILQDGERRLRAWHLVWQQTGEEPYFLARFTDKEMTEAERIISMFISQDNRKFTPIEAAKCIFMLNNLNYDDQTIASKIGKPAQFVKDAILLYRQSGEIKEAVQKNHVSMTTAVKVIRTSRTESEATDTIRTAVAKSKETGKKQSGSKVLTPVKKTENAKQEKAEAMADAISQQFEIGNENYLSLTNLIKSFL